MRALSEAQAIRPAGSLRSSTASGNDSLRCGSVFGSLRTARVPLAEAYATARHQPQAAGGRNPAVLRFSFDRPFAPLRNGRSGLSFRFPERPVGLSGPTPSRLQSLAALPPSREWIAFGQTVAYCRLAAGVLGLTGETQGLSGASSIEPQSVSLELNGLGERFGLLGKPYASPRRSPPGRPWTSLRRSTAVVSRYIICSIRFGFIALCVWVLGYRPPPSPANSAYACRPSRAVIPPGGPD